MSIWTCTRRCSTDTLPVLAALLLGLTALPAAANKDVIVDKVWVRESVPGQTAATLQLNLSVISAARLLGVSSPLAESGEIARVEHRGGRMQTRPLSSLKLAAHSTVIFGVRGLYLVLRGLKQPLNTGERMPVSLLLEVGGKRQTVEVSAEVRALELSYKHYNDPAVMDHR